MAAAGALMSQAGVAAIYCVHGSFCGDDPLGLLTELEAWSPRFAAPLRRWSKRTIDAVIGETANYTPAFAQRMETALSADAAERLPVRLFNWSSQNHHAARADGAVRLVDELARVAEQIPSGQVDPRVLLWAHSHGGNVFALMTNLLGADEAARREFFHASRTFFRPSFTSGSDVPAWERVEWLLDDSQHPLRRLKLDLVTYGTPIRYGWDAGGYRQLLHVIHHRPHARHAEHAVAYPPRPDQVLRAEHGDYIQQVGVAGTNFPPLPIAWRTFLADHRLGKLLQRDLGGWLRSRLKQGMRVHAEGTTLLIDYDDPHWAPWRHMLGHAPYTRSQWLPLHCELAAKEFYGDLSGRDN